MIYMEGKTLADNEKEPINHKKKPAMAIRKKLRICEKETEMHSTDLIREVIYE